MNRNRIQGGERSGKKEETTGIFLHEVIQIYKEIKEGDVLFNKNTSI